MKRKPGELRYDFCARRIMEQEATKEALRPKLVWVSSVLVSSSKPADYELPAGMRPLVKLKARGTYRKPVEEVDEC